jgi:ABC-type multidrug transport system ATPase subunit
MLAGLSRPDAGSVYAAKSASIGFFSHNLSMYGRLTARENLDLFRSVSDLTRDTLKHAEEVWDLNDCAHKQVADLSKGTQARVSLARVFMTSPSVALLDEPTSNLDNRSTETLLHAVRTDAESRCVVIATHDIHRLRDIATRVLVLDRGEVVADSGAAAEPSSISRVVDYYLESNR